MKGVYHLAFRNLFEHKSKSIIISSLLIIGVTVCIVGNSFLVTINNGIEEDFRSNYTGDILISTKPEKGERIDFFGVVSSDLMEQKHEIPPLNEIEKIEEILKQNNEIKGYTKQISTKCFISKNSELDLSIIHEKTNMSLKDVPLCLLCAEEEATYSELFNSIDYIEGTYPKENSNEILIEYREKRAYELLFKEELNVGDTVIVMDVNGTTVIREAVVCGFFKPINDNSSIIRITYCTPFFARSFAEFTYGNISTQNLPENTSFNINDYTEDELFSDFFTDDSDIYTSDSIIDYDSILGDTSLRNELNKGADGAWQLILIKVKRPGKTDDVINDLRQKCEAENLNVQVLDWKEGAYSYSQTLKEIILLFNLLIFILAFVVVIIIINTILVSITERVNEIGTMRAIGADKGFIFLLFISETVMISVFSFAVGTCLSLIIMWIINSCRIPIESGIAITILGGGCIHFKASFRIIGITFLVTVFGCVLSNIFPIRSALRITPIKALNND